MKKLILQGQPISTQSCYRSSTRNGFNRTYMVAKCVDLKRDYTIQAQQQWKQSPVTEPIAIIMELHHGDKRKRDIDNFNKLIFDSLTDIVFKDDSQIEKLTIEKFYDKENPRVELKIYELPNV